MAPMISGTSDTHPGASLHLSDDRYFDTQLEPLEATVLNLQIKKQYQLLSPRLNQVLTEATPPHHPTHNSKSSLNKSTQVQQQNMIHFWNPQDNLSNPTYRVFIKEGQKVNAYFTVKIYLFGASMGFILTTTYEHQLIYTKDLKYFN